MCSTSEQFGCRFVLKLHSARRPCSQSFPIRVKAGKLLWQSIFANLEASPSSPCSWTKAVAGTALSRKEKMVTKQKLKGLRHTAGTILSEAGLDDKTIAADELEIALSAGRTKTAKLVGRKCQTVKRKPTNLPSTLRRLVRHAMSAQLHGTITCDCAAEGVAVKLKMNKKRLEAQRSFRVRLRAFSLTFGLSREPIASAEGNAFTSASKKSE